MRAQRKRRLGWRIKRLSARNVLPPLQDCLAGGAARIVELPECEDRQGAIAEVNRMSVFWERTGILLPIYRLVARGKGDADIATQLNIPQLSVQGCVAWMVYFLKLRDRSEL